VARSTRITTPLRVSAADVKTWLSETDFNADYLFVEAPEQYAGLDRASEGFEMLRRAREERTEEGSRLNARRGGKRP
jgi:hypothetical protein